MTNKSNQVTISKDDIVEASRRGAMSPQDVESLWAHLSTLTSNAPAAASRSFDLIQLVTYGGFALVLVAMSWFMEQATVLIGSGGTLALSAVYAALFAGLGYKLRYRDEQKTAGGVLFTLAVLMAPIATFAGLDSFAANMGADSKALVAEIVTIAVGLAALSKIRFSFLSAPVFGAMWFLSMTAAALLSPGGLWIFFGSQAFLHTSMAIGAVILLSALVTDTTYGRDEDYAWWGYFFGVLAFWVPMSLMDTGSEWGRFAYFGVNVAMMFASVILSRKVFLVAGAIGSLGYIAHMLWTYSSNSIFFPGIVGACGLGIIYLGVLYKRNQTKIENAILGLVPAGVRARLPH